MQNESTSHTQPNKENNPVRLLKGSAGEIVLGEEEMAIASVAAAAATAQLISPPILFAEKIGELTERLKRMYEESSKLHEKLKTYKKDNTAMSQKMGTLESNNRKQEETIRNLEGNQEKLHKELENVKKAKDQLRVELEEKTSKFSTENKILTEKFEDLTKEFEAVENENKELKRSLEQLTDSNNTLKETVDSIKKENQHLKVDMSNLKAEHDRISKKLECKETRLALGQVAWILEAEIWKAVLPKEEMGKTRILRSMERWLKKNSSSDKGKAAQKRWENLKLTLGWDDDDHKSALKILKDLSVDDAHPQNVDLEVARKQLNEGDYIANAEKQSCEDIINMIVKARKLNSAM